MCVGSVNHVQLSVTLWMVACQDPLSMGLFSLEYWSVLSFPSPGDLPDPGIEPQSAALQADSLPSEPLGKALIREYLLVCVHYLLLNTIYVKFTLFVE